MPDEHGSTTNPGYRGLHILDVVGDGARPQRLRRRTTAMRPQADRCRAEPASGEVLQEVLVPTPCGVKAAVYEPHRRRVVRPGTTFVDEFQHLAPDRS